MRSRLKNLGERQIKCSRRGRNMRFLFNSQRLPSEPERLEEPDFSAAPPTFFHKANQTGRAGSKHCTSPYVNNKPKHEPPWSTRWSRHIRPHSSLHSSSKNHCVSWAHRLVSIASWRTWSRGSPSTAASSSSAPGSYSFSPQLHRHGRKSAPHR